MAIYNEECKGCRYRKNSEELGELLDSKEQWLSKLVDLHDFSVIDTGLFIVAVKWFANPVAHSVTDDQIKKLAEAGMEV